MSTLDLDPHSVERFRLKTPIGNELRETKAQLVEAQKQIAGQRHLHDRIETLEEENRQLRDMMRPDIHFATEWRLTAQQSRFLALIYSRAIVTYSQIVVAFDINLQADGNDSQNHVKVVACNTRRKLAPFGIKFNTIWGVGYAVDGENKARIRAGIISAGL